MQTPWSDEAAGLRVAIDIGMESLMSDGELASLATQVMLSYAFVVKRCVAQNWRPLRLALTNTDAAAATLARIRDAASAVRAAATEPKSTKTVPPKEPFAPRASSAFSRRSDISRTSGWTLFGSAALAVALGSGSS